MTYCVPLTLQLSCLENHIDPAAWPRAASAAGGPLCTSLFLGTSSSFAVPQNFPSTPTPPARHTHTASQPATSFPISHRKQKRGEETAGCSRGRQRPGTHVPVTVRPPSSPCALPAPATPASPISVGDGTRKVGTKRCLRRGSK